MDTDVIVFGDILGELQKLEYADMYFQNDYRAVQHLCDGIMYIHSSDQSLIVYHNLFKYFPKCGYHDQCSIIESLKETTTPFKLIPYSIVENGVDFFRGYKYPYNGTELFYMISRSNQLHGSSQFWLFRRVQVLQIEVNEYL
jgi:hypothetical protein